LVQAENSKKAKRPLPQTACTGLCRLRPSAANITQQDTIIAQDEAIPPREELDGVQVTRHIVCCLVTLPALATICAFEQTATATAGICSLAILVPATDKQEQQEAVRFASATSSYCTSIYNLLSNFIHTEATFSH
jgi:hypothetical protein